MTGQRRASTCSLEMVPPQGEGATAVVAEAATAGRAAVVMARRPAAVAFFMNGHMALDWRRAASMVMSSTSVSEYRRLFVSFFFLWRGVQWQSPEALLGRGGERGGVHKKRRAN